LPDGSAANSDSNAEVRHSSPVKNRKRDYEVRESRIFISFLAAFNASHSRTAITRSPTNTSALIVCNTKMKVATQPTRL
jgi:hypothetical protein